MMRIAAWPRGRSGSPRSWCMFVICIVVRWHTHPLIQMMPYCLCVPHRLHSLADQHNIFPTHCTITYVLIIINAIFICLSPSWTMCDTQRGQRATRAQKPEQNRFALYILLYCSGSCRTNWELGGRCNIAHYTYLLFVHT